jgi:hypothetical protein
MKTKMILFFGLVLAFSITDISAQAFINSKSSQEGICQGNKNRRFAQAKARRKAHHHQMNISKGVHRAKYSVGRNTRLNKDWTIYEKHIAERNTYSYNQNKRSRF